VHLKKSEETMKDGMDEHHVVEAVAFHHGMHCHLQSVEHQSAQTKRYNKKNIAL